jgi:hypothetical protein
MKTINDPHNQLMTTLFRKMPLEVPSARFTEKLSTRIRKEQGKQRRKRRWLTIMQMAAGVLGVIVVPTGLVYWLTDFSFSAFTTNLSFDPLIIAIGLPILLLLISDSLIQKHIRS